MSKLPAVQWLCMAIAAICLIAFYATGFNQSEPCDVTGGASLYCDLHPMSFVDIIGIVTFTGGALLFSGVWLLFVKDDGFIWDRSGTVRIILLAVIVASWLLIKFF